MIFDAIRRWFGSGGNGAGGRGDAVPDPLSCQDALSRLYEYLDGELEPETRERIHEHLEVCQRCYPYFDFERIFLDYVREKGLAVGETGGLRERVEALLEEAE
jgi:anti-sigma factor (TIGR02949 family)